jgi:antitoxin component YwqK of YwqJK toxin-antitoxin module
MMRASISGIFALILAASGCSDAPRIVLADDPDLTLRNDSLFLVNKPFTGTVSELEEDGDTILIDSWRQGVQHGRFKQWYMDGQPAEERNYENGQKTGTHRGWYPDGKPRFVYEFSQGEHHGKAEEWYPNGKPYRIFHYKAGYEDGLQQMWWEDGTLRANYAVRNGRRYGLIGLKLCRNPSDSMHP